MVLKAMFACVAGVLMLTHHSLALASDKTANEKKRVGDNLSESVEHLSSFIPAKPIEQVTPTYPRRAAVNRNEGWVQMSYIVDREGNVQDPVVDDYVGTNAFRQYALMALKKWKFEPAMRDGEPTQQCYEQVQFDFVLEGVSGASQAFVDRYKEIELLIGENNLDEAALELEKLHASVSGNRYENAWLWNIDAILAEKQSNKRRELRSLNRVLSSLRTHSHEETTFDTDYIAFIQQRLFMLNAQFGYLVSALRVAEQLSGMEDQQHRYKQIEASVIRIKAFIASKKPIQVSAKINESGVLFHSLARNNFAFSNVDGRLDAVEVRCKSHREKFTVAEQHIWQIPKSWGKCRVLVEGMQDTVFELVEVADS